MSTIGTGGVEESIAEVERARTLQDTPPRRRPRGNRNRDALPGWLFIAPAVIVIVIFVLLPVISALWVSLSAWTGKGSPLRANYIGFDNYQALLTKPGLAQRDLGAPRVPRRRNRARWGEQPFVEGNDRLLLPRLGRADDDAHGLSLEAIV